MIRKITGLALLMVALLAAYGTAAGQAGKEGGEKPKGTTTKAPYVHAVYFYLKKDAPKDEVAKLIQASHTLLGKIPTVRGLWVGRPAEKSTPKVAVTDYTVGLLVLFEDYAGLQTYLDHPLHTEYLEKHGKHWDRVSVYDFMNQKK